MLSASIKIVKKIPILERNFVAPPRMIVIWSFDVNKPGFEVDEIRGGVAGGSIVNGVLRVNQMIEVRPGHVNRDESGNIKCTPYYWRIVSLYAEQKELQFAVFGGLIGVGTTLDRTLTRADKLVGQVLTEVNFFLLRKLLGVRTRESERQSKVSISRAEILTLNIGSNSSPQGMIWKNCSSRRRCAAAEERRIERHWRLIGWGTIQAGIMLDAPPTVQF